MKILITDPVDPQCSEILRAEGFHVDVRTGLQPSEVQSAIPEYEALIVRSSTDVTPDIIHAGTKLKVIGRAGAGVDNIDVQAATRHGIIVMNTPGGNTISTAEHTMSLLLALARNIPQAHQSLQKGKWERKAFIGTELAGKTIGVLGLGKVGKEVARRCLAFDMVVLGYDPVVSREAASKLNIELLDLQQVLKRSDFVTVHTPLNEETRGLLGEETLSLCKPGVRIINCARGGIVDETALRKALERGHVAGAALDVYENEPPGDNPLLQHPHVVATPHLGASTEEAQEKVAVQIAHQVADVLHGRGVSGSVNADAIQLSMQGDLQPYLVLAEKLGALTAQLMQGKLRAVNVVMSGDVLQKSGPVILAAVLKGIFESLLSEPVNYINAPLIAQERGILSSDSRERENIVYTNLVRVQYETDKEKRVLNGTVFGHHNVRVVGLDSFHFEVNPEGHMLFYYNADRPGMLAAVGTILSKENINIAGVALGRSAVGGKALTIMNLDNSFSQGVLEKILKIEGVSEARLVKI